MEKSKGLKLFGVRIFEEEVGGGEEVMRKCASMGNLVSCAAPAGENSGGDHAGYSSDGGLLKSNRKRRRDPGLERKKGVPWTEEEHRTFLAGLEKLGKGDWRGISRSFVTTRTPTQVASHAQKYFLRQTNPSKKKRRSSLFDVQINEKAGGSTMFEIKHDEIVNEDDSRINNPYNDSISSGEKEQEGPVVMDSELELSIGLPSKLPSSQYAAIGAIRVL